MRTLGPIPARLLLLACLASACAPIRFTSQDVVLKHDPDHDVLDVLVLYNEIERSDGDAAKTDQFAIDVVEGKRHFMLFDWPLDIDLDRLEADPPQETGRWAEWEKDCLALLKGVSVERSGFFRSEGGKLSLFQQLRIKDIGRLVAVFDRALSLHIEESIASGQLEQALPHFDARTRDMWAEWSKKKPRWLTLESGVVGIDLPMSSRSAAQLLAEWTKGCTQDNTGVSALACLLSPITEISIAGDRARVRWGTAGAPLSFHFEVEGEYRPDLSSSLADSGKVPKKLPSRSELFARFQAR
jgi:hypothetical protein